MQYRTYGKIGIRVSVLGFGVGRFPVARREFGLDRVVGILRRAFDLGVNYVDTAEVYSMAGRVSIPAAVTEPQIDRIGAVQAL
jgi:predicted aldo/keto reductase-like oxidoreductase